MDQLKQKPGVKRSKYSNLSWAQYCIFMYLHQLITALRVIMCVLFVKNNMYMCDVCQCMLSCIRTMKFLLHCYFRIAILLINL